MNADFLYALLGGILIGLSASIMLLFNGRITGISGILSGVLLPAKSEWLWRAIFVVGMLVGGLVLAMTEPSRLENTLGTPSAVVIIAGLLVGFGTRLGSGCTSGHGVCGISRLSGRSIVATLSFIAAGVLTVSLLREVIL